ncbi:MAG TPA: NAD-dependent epimerase/dehydratase family protein, partial [Candidatus Synoicihabitans sp.]|nr:NAD-dependent epimerase/dehydratase family protein [Candidatus Synoicihabitans sp.]
ARVLFTSSGSVYGRRAASLASADGGGVAETDWGVLDAMDTATAYAISGQAKRAAEQWCAAYHREHGLNVVVARCFTFLGPGMPLAGKFAAGNFLADALGGRDIVIRGDGTAVRSYLYASDLAIWLWRLLLEGPAGRAFNVGAEEAVSLRELAEIVREEVAPQVAVRVLGEKGPSGVADVYVPRTAKAREELGLRATVSLREAVRRTADWLGCSRPR